MSNRNESTKQYIEYYCKKDFSPKFAILVKGEWGSGKTHIVREYFANQNPATEDDRVKFLEILSLIHISEPTRPY